VSVSVATNRRPPIGHRARLLPPEVCLGAACRLFSWTLPFILGVFGLARIATAAGAAITVCPQPVCRSCGPISSCLVEVPILVSGDRELDAIGFDVDFPVHLSYSGIARGPVTRAWFDFEAKWTAPNHIRVGGFDGTGTTLAGTDTLCVLSFRTVANYQGNVRTYAFVDDLEGAEECTAAVQVGGTSTSDVYLAVVPKSSPMECCFDTPDGTELQVVARDPEGTTGFLATAFRIVVSPPAVGAFFTWTPAPGVTSTGESPVDNGSASSVRGVTVSSHECATLNSTGVELGTITVQGLSGQHDLFIRKIFPAPPEMYCFFVQGCDPCPHDMYCLSRNYDPVVYHAIVNAVSCGSCGRVAVKPVTWGGIKSVYR